MEGLSEVHATTEEIQQNPYGVLTKAIIEESLLLLLLFYYYYYYYYYY